MIMFCLQTTGQDCVAEKLIYYITFLFDVDWYRLNDYTADQIVFYSYLLISLAIGLFRSIYVIKKAASRRPEPAAKNVTFPTSETFVFGKSTATLSD